MYARQAVSQTALLVAIACAGMTATRAEAGWPWGGYASPYLGSYVGYSTYTQDYIPYFAKHPPVYYSYPVARPYGSSPYAYPPTVATPGPTRPLVIGNPHVSQKAQRAAGDYGPEPLRIINPHVRDSGPCAATYGETTYGDSVSPDWPVAPKVAPKASR